MKGLLFALALTIAPIASADVLPFSYHLGAVAVSESEYDIVVHAKSPISVAILPGGKSWPILSLDQSGRIYVGNTVIDATTGRASTAALATLALPHGVQIAASGNHLQFRHAGKRCVLSPPQLGLDNNAAILTALQNRNLVFSNSRNALRALVTQFDANGDVSAYLTEKIDIGTCRVIERQNIGNPDMLIEMGNSTQGGWWITGSIEQTLLQSMDGEHWRKVGLPLGLSSLVSAYVVNPREIWLAGILVAEEESPYLLVVSENGGETWRNVMAGDPVLKRLPVGWLEGQKRLGQAGQSVPQQE